MLSVLHNTATNIRIIVVDNGSVRPVADEAWAQCVEVIRNETNAGWIKAINQGMEISSAPYFLMLNDDIRIRDGDHGWLDSLIEPMRNDPRCGAVGPTSNFVMGIQTMHAQMLGPNGDTEPLPAVHRAGMLIGFAMLVRREAMLEVGGLDERFGLGGCDDLDYSLRLSQGGWSMKVQRGCYIHHYGKKTTGRDGDEAYRKLDDDAREVLVAKWSQNEVDALFQTPREWFE